MNQNEEIRKCRSCQAEVRFLKLAPKKGEEGKFNWAIVDFAPRKVWIRIGKRWVVTTGFEDHHATCPHADQHRAPQASQDTQDAPAEDEYGF